MEPWGQEDSEVRTITHPEKLLLIVGNYHLEEPQGLAELCTEVINSAFDGVGTVQTLGSNQAIECNHAVQGLRLVCCS